MFSNSLVQSIGISLGISSIVVLINNYFLYKHSCKKKEERNLNYIIPINTPFNLNKF